jgi:hypothetical protein
MNEAETYIRELRRALPIGCRRRFVAEVREHFASAVAAEAKLGVGRLDAERLTIERLGAPRALADQLLADLRSGALGPGGRLTVALTTTRLFASAAVLATAIGLGAVFIGTRSSSAPPTPAQATRSPQIVDHGTDVRKLVLTLVDIQRKHGSTRPTLTRVQVHVPPTR